MLGPIMSDALYVNCRNHTTEQCIDAIWQLIVYMLQLSASTSQNQFTAALGGLVV